MAMASMVSQCRHFCNVPLLQPWFVTQCAWQQPPSCPNPEGECPLRAVVPLWKSDKHQMIYARLTKVTYSSALHLPVRTGYRCSSYNGVEIRDASLEWATYYNAIGVVTLVPREFFPTTETCRAYVDAVSGLANVIRAFDSHGAGEIAVTAVAFDLHIGAR